MLSSRQSQHFRERSRERLGFILKPRFEKMLAAKIKKMEPTKQEGFINTYELKIDNKLVEVVYNIKEEIFITLIISGQ